MTNPLALAIKTNPKLLLEDLDSELLLQVVRGAIDVLEDRHKRGRTDAAGALQGVYRRLSDMEI